MKEHGAYTPAEAASYDTEREIEPLWHIENTFVRDLIARSAFRSVLDVPVGTGRFLEYYGNRSVTGTDLSESMLELARSRATSLYMDNVYFRRCSVTDLPFAAGSFDLVLCWRLLHLLPPESLAPALSELARVCCSTLCVQAYERAHLTVRLTAKAGRWARRLWLPLSGKRRLTAWSHIRTYAHSRIDIERAAHAAGIGDPTSRTHIGDYEGTRVVALIWSIPQ